MALFGLTPAELRSLKVILAEILPAATPCWIFGSRARGDFKRFSDIDLLVTHAMDLKLKGKLRERFEQSSLPYKVDVVFESELADDYRDSVNSEKRAIP